MNFKLELTVGAFILMGFAWGAVVKVAAAAKPSLRTDLRWAPISPRGCCCRWAG